MDQPISVIGMRCIFPQGCDNLDKFWDFIINNKNAVSQPKENRFWPQINFKGCFIEDLEYFDYQAFGIKKEEAFEMDPYQRVAIKTVNNALQELSYQPNTGVFVAMSESEYQYFVSKLRVYTSLGVAQAIVANRISNVFNFNGPSMIIDTACSSSLVAVHQAINSLKSNDYQRAIVWD